MKHYTKHLAILIICFGQTVGHAQPISHALVEGFPDSLLVSSEFEPDSVYRLILGRLQRSRGVVIPESEERIRGDISKLIFEISLNIQLKMFMVISGVAFPRRGMMSYSDALVESVVAVTTGRMIFSEIGCFMDPSAISTS